VALINDVLRAEAEMATKKFNGAENKIKKGCVTVTLCNSQQNIRGRKKGGIAPAG
jgi:hypothetical protein